MKKYLVILCIACTGMLAFKLTDSLQFYVPKGWPEPHYDFKENPLTRSKTDLGRALFYDPVLSADSTISCVSCHSQYTAFAHVDHDLSHGIRDSIGTRNAPVLTNLAWNKFFMWDGAIHHLDVQSLAPISHPAEMGENIDHVVQKLQRSKLYPQLFYRAWQDSVITGEHVLKAISQFMLTLVSANSKYDKVMRGDTVFTAQEANGYELFKANCASCHKEPLFTTGEFANNGLPVDTTLNDYGRYRITGNPEDSLKFKIPTLRNIEFSYPYMHDGRFKRLSQVINHYTRGIEHNKTLAVELQQPITLSANEKVDMVAFLLTLTDREFLFNPDFSYPKEIFDSGAKE